MNCFSLLQLKQQAANAFIFTVFTFLFFSLAYAAISWPSAPAGETTGGKYSTSLVPSGFVGAFNLVTCPSGWKVADGTNSTPDLRGEFIRGLDLGRNIDIWRVLWSWQTDMLKSHTHGYSNDIIIGSNGDHYTNGGSNIMSDWSNSQTTTPTGGSETRPRNIALLYCQKN